MNEDKDNLRKQEIDRVSELLERQKDGSSNSASSSIETKTHIVSSSEQNLDSLIEQLLEQVMQISSIVKEGNFDDNEIISKVQVIGNAINQLESNASIHDISAYNNIQKLIETFTDNGLSDFLD